MLILFRLLFPATRAALAAAGLLGPARMYGGTTGNGGVSAGQILETQSYTAGQFLEAQSQSAGALLEAQGLSAGQYLETQNRSAGEFLDAQERGRFEP
jgi:hypothetical protein